ncbi:MAG: protein translocase subunit SecD [Phycisphaerales bacterium]|nr:protein translocase subunit SecD [Planctomycetota bacterium]MCH8509569.1 protein translocase subunit SecD [Phycisphaerales bacterium]
MRHLVRNICIALALILFAVWQAYPPGDKIKLGKDLQGGSTLVYTVQMDRAENPDEIIPQIIEVLKRRIDPNGLFEISIVQQGQDRIEITMPLPGERVKALRQAFEDELNRLRIASIEPAEFERMMRLPAQERSEAIDRISVENPVLREELLGAVDAFERGVRFRQELRAAERNNAPDEVLDELARQAAEAEIEYEVARDQVRAAAIGPEQIRRALELPDEQRRIRDERTGDIVTVESARSRALARIRAENPHISEQLDRVVEAFNTFSAQRSSLDDTSDLKRLVQASGQLSFRITVDPQAGSGTATHPEEQRLREELRERGPRQARASDARWFRINRLDNWYDTVQEYEAISTDPAGFFLSRGYVVEEYAGNYFMLAWDARGMRMTGDDGRWRVARAYQTQDQLGRPAIGFEMDPVGAVRLGELTGDNVNNRMAVLLDDEVYTAPNLRARISSRGIIEGEFTPEEINYVVRVMTAGSLQAKLSAEPISESTIAPELGQDNLDAGTLAGMVALVVVCVFMIIYYFGYGFVAVSCLVANAILIIGALALSRAALTLPGIAGIILTFGMAVDANVLIFERIREELRKGLDLRTSVRLGYEKALSAIVDGNVTNLIVCFVLANVGTQEIRGFAITLGIGVACTMISALFFSRIIMVVLIDKLKVRKMGMLATAVPAIHRFLEPNIDWLRYRGVFVIVSAIFVGLGIAMILSRGERMLDTEFRGGTQVTMTFRDGVEPASRTEIEQIVRGLGEEAPEASPIRQFRIAEIIAVNPIQGGLISSTFIIKTLDTDRQAVGAALTAAFQDRLDAPPPLEFASSEVTEAQIAPVYPLLSGTLGDNVGRPELRDNVTEFVGGVAILLDHLGPRQTVEQLRNRLNIMRGKEDFVDALGRQMEVRVLEGTNDAVVSAVVLTLDPGLLYLDNPDAWQSEVAQREWDLVRAALTTSSDTLSVQNFSPAIAASFRERAVVAVVLSLLLILIYIWVRFGSVRYSMAAIATLAHDVFVALGLIALAEIIYDSQATWLQNAAQAALIEPFKIDLTLVAAMLTIIGYSLNDTIIIMDRVRENRGKLSYATRDVVNLSINQTISRTVITSGTTMLAVLILYIYGGTGVRAFSYTLLIGVLFGTYSSIAVAAPFIWSRKADKSGAFEPLPRPDDTPI